MTLIADERSSQAHWDATTNAKILHRDVSSGNIVIVEEKKGTLIDWELCRCIGPGTARCHDKTIGLHRSTQLPDLTFCRKESSSLSLFGCSERHKVGDDLKPFVHVLTWIAIYSECVDSTLPYMVFERFDPPVSGMGGDDKVQLLKQDWSAVTDIDLEQKPFSDVLKCIYSRFGCRHGSRWYQELEMENKDAAKAEVEKLETHDWLHSVLKKALQNIKWMETGDGRVEQEVLEDDKLSDGKTGEKKKIYA